MNSQSLEILGDDQLALELNRLNGWSVKEGKLSQSFKFPEFGAAVGFVVQVSIIAEKLGHHPEWSGVYTIVELGLDTHEVGGITSLDIEFALEVDKI